MEITKKFKRSIAKRALAIAMSLTMVAGVIPGQMTGTLQTEAAELASLQAVSLEVAKEGCVLLKNDNNVLPLKDKKVALFGRAQIDTFYKGYGSGGYVESSTFTNVLEYMKKSESAKKIDLNDTIVKKYEDWVKKNPGDVTHVTWSSPITYNPEMELSDSDVSNAAKESEVAVVVIGRRWGEGRDLKLGKEDGQYYLTSKEKDMLSKVNKHFKNIVVVFNTASVMDMEWIANNTYSNIDAYLIGWVGGMQVGRAITEVLVGDTTPSGKLPVTIMDNLLNDETNNNYGKYPDKTPDDCYKNKENIYQEDIYLGYRYTETFGDEHVLFPFGHGLSYTTFETKTNSITVEKGNSIKEDVIKVSTTVTNTGSKYSGKEVVQVYYGAPQGKLGKPAKTLVAYAKTGELAPGKSQNLTLSFKVGDMASYDETGKTSSDNKSSYVLEAGNYPIYVGNSVKAKQPSCYSGYKVEKLTRTEKLQEAQAPDKSFKRTVAKEENGKIVPKMEDVPTAKRDLDKRILENLPKEIKQKTSGSKFKLIEVYKGNKTIEEFVAQLTTEQVCRLCAGEGGMKDGDGISGNAGVFGSGDKMDSTFGIPKVSACDGPAGIRWNGKATAIPSAIVIGSTWNDELTEKLCVELGKECIATTQSGNKGIDVLLAPGMNIIRNPRCGRNYEYFSEDPLLTGRLASAYVSGLQSTGVAASVKHFAAFSQGQYDGLLQSYMSERCLREIYLKPFEICTKESNPYTYMTAYGGVNGEAASGCYDLNNTILRKEWGWNGMIMTDWGPPSSSYNGSRGKLEKMAHWVQGGQDLNMPGKDKDEKHLVNSVKKSNGGLSLAEAQNAAINVLNCIMKTPKFARENKLDFYKYEEPKYERFTVDTKVVVKPTLDKIYVNGEAVSGFDPSGYEYTLFHKDLSNLPKVTYDVPEGSTAKATTSGATTTITVKKEDQESVYKVTFTNEAGLLPTVSNPTYAYLDDIAVDGKSIYNFFPTDVAYNVVYTGNIKYAKITCKAPEGVEYKVTVDENNNKIIVRSESEHQAIEYVLTMVKEGEAAGEAKEPFKVKEKNVNNCNRMYLADEAYYMYHLGTEDSDNEEKGNRNLSNIEADSYALYNIEVETSGYYQLNVREASNLDKEATYQLDFGVSIDGTTTAVWAPLGGTEGWQNWQTLEGNTVYLSKGTHKIKLYFLMTGLNLCWLEFIPGEMVELETRPNRALNRPAVATYEENTDSYKGLATNAVDGDLSSRWSSSGGDGLPQGVQVDLGKEYAIDKTELYFFGDGREYTYDVYLTDTEVIKNNGIQSDATPVLKDQKGTGSGAGGAEGTKMTMVKLPEGSVGRYLTVVVKEESQKNIAALWELRAYGSENKEDPVGDAKAAIEAIGEVTLEKEDLIKKARTAYDKLTDAQKKEISEDVLKKLTDAEAKIIELKTPEVTDPTNTYEAESAALTSACVVTEGKTSSNGKYVGELGGEAGGKATFTVNVEKAGKYDVDIYYITYYDREFEVTVNDGKAVTVTCTGNNNDWDTTVMKATVSADLKAGINTIAISNTKDFAPNLDKIVLNLKAESGDNGEIATPEEQAKAALQVVVDVAGTYKEADYTADSWKEFKTALDAAKTELENEEATADSLNSAKDVLIAAQNKLVKTAEDSEELAKAKEELNIAVAAAKKIMDEGQDKYTEASWKAFDKAYADATNPTAILTASAAKLNQLTEALTAAQTALELKQSGEVPPSDVKDEKFEAAKAELEKAVQAAKTVYTAGQGNNTGDVWATFRNAYIAASAELKKTTATTETLTKALNDLKTAQDALSTETPDDDKELKEAKEALDEAVNTAKDIIAAGNTAYTEDSWNAFVSAYNEATKAESDATADEMQTLKDNLKAAQDGLKKTEQQTPNTNPPVSQDQTPTGNMNQVTVVLEETTLYYGGNDGKTTMVKVELPTGVAAKSTVYASDNEKVAKVGADGRVSAVGKGNANITATVSLANGESKTFTLNVTVKKAYIEKVSVKSTVKVGKKVTLKAKAFGSKKKITWKIKSGSKYAKLTAKGKFTAKAKGKVKVVAKSGKISKTFTIRIK